LLQLSTEYSVFYLALKNTTTKAYEVEFYMEFCIQVKLNLHHKKSNEDYGSFRMGAEEVTCTSQEENDKKLKQIL